MKNKTILFYIIENEKVSVEKNISEAKRVYSEFAGEIHIVYNKDYISQIICVLQSIDALNTDKVIILTNKLIGPLYPLQEMFEKMEQVLCDFWTLTKAGKNAVRDVTEHFQFHFCVFNKSFFQNPDIRKSILENRHIKDETELSDLLTGRGAHGETYINIDRLETRALDYRIDASIEAPYLLVKDYACPYIRLEAFMAENDLSVEIRELMSYLKETQIYDIDRVWEYLLASCDISDIYTKLSLHHVYSTKFSTVKKKKYANTALLVHLYYEDLTAECLGYIESLASIVDIYISTGNDITYIRIKEDAARRKIRIKEIRKIENRGRDVASLLYYCRDIWDKYEYFGFIHDKKSAGARDVLQGDKYRYGMWENLVASKEYVYNILEEFKKEDKLGLAVPPMPKNDSYRYSFWTAWGDNFENMKQLAQRLQLQVPIDNKKPLFALSTCFWCRTKALEKLYRCRFDISEFDLEPFPEDGALSHAIERILPFVAQDAGYYTISVETEEFASLELAYYFSRMQEIKKHQEETTKYQNLYNRATLGMNSILGFVSRYKRIYVYGCGNMANEVTRALLLNNIEYEGYIVTKKEADTFFDKPVYALEDIPKDKDTGIIVAVGVKLKAEIEVLLKNKEIDYYLWRQ